MTAQGSRKYKFSWTAERENTKGMVILFLENPRACSFCWSHEWNWRARRARSYAAAAAITATPCLPMPIRQSFK